MELSEALSRRRMVRRFRPDPVPNSILERVLEAALSAPSAGFSQGLDLVVIDEPEDLERFWGAVDPLGRKNRAGAGPPVIVVPCTSSRAYIERYSRPDKRGLGLDRIGGWPVPYWHVDAGMAVMAILLTAVDEGLGSWFFGLFHGEDQVRRELRIPDTHEPIGAVALGYAHPEDAPVGSSLLIDRRAPTEVIHRGSWRGAAR